MVSGIVLYSYSIYLYKQCSTVLHVLVSGKDSSPKLPTQLYMGIQSAPWGLWPSNFSVRFVPINTWFLVMKLRPRAKPTIDGHPITLHCFIKCVVCSNCHHFCWLNFPFTLSDYRYYSRFILQIADSPPRCTSFQHPQPMPPASGSRYRRPLAENYQVPKVLTMLVYKSMNCRVDGGDMWYLQYTGFKDQQT